MPSMMSYPSAQHRPLSSTSPLGLTLSLPGIGFWGAMSLTSAVVSGRHGYLRHNRSPGWALGWGALGLLFPILTPAWAVFVQGYGQRER